MVVHSVEADELWQLLWAHTAHELIMRLPRDPSWEIFSAGNGWGLRRQDDQRRALLLHPSGAARSTGDLALTLADQGTHPIPRYGHSYPAYLALVEDAVATVCHEHLA
jgi:hypothetical protein